MVSLFLKVDPGTPMGPTLHIYYQSPLKKKPKKQGLNFKPSAKMPQAENLINPREHFRQIGQKSNVSIPRHFFFYPAATARAA